MKTKEQIIKEYEIFDNVPDAIEQITKDIEKLIEEEYK